MTVASQATKIIYQGNDAAVNFRVPFSVMDERHIRCRVMAEGVEKDTEDFSLEIDSENNLTLLYPASGYPPLGVGNMLVIYRHTPLDQEIDLVEGGPFHAEVHEEAFDKACMQIQELREQLDRAVTIDMSDANPPTAGGLLAELRSIAGEARGSANNSADSAAAAAQSVVDARGAVDAAVAEAKEAARQAQDVIGGAMPPAWSNTVNYAVGQITLWNDEIRQAVKASGPESGAGPVSPDDADFWSVLKGGGGDINPYIREQFDVAGTYNWTAPHTGKYKVTVIGAGGGSGGVRLAADVANGCTGGGGGGGGAYKIVSLTKGQQVPVVVGAGGAAGAPGGNGGNGGISGFGALISCTGGLGSMGISNTWHVPLYYNGAKGGAGFGGDFNMNGGTGVSSTYNDSGASVISPGAGGDSMLNPGPYQTDFGVATPGALGCGASGMQINASPSYSAGGAKGGDGVVIIESLSVYVDDVERNIYGGYVSEYRTFPGLSVAPVGWEPADGGWSNNATNYGELLNWFDQHPEILKSNTDWEAMQSAHGGEGGVPFWVYDVANNRIRRPDWRGDIATQAGGSIAVNAAQRDAQQPITGSLETCTYSNAGNINPTMTYAGSGALASKKEVPIGFTTLTETTYPNSSGIALDSSKVVRTASENRPKRIGVIGCVYMGKTFAQPPVIPSTGRVFGVGVETFTGDYFTDTDGVRRKLYTYVVDCGALPDNTTKAINHNIPNVRKIHKEEGLAYSSSGDVYPLPFINYFASVPGDNIQLNAGLTTVRMMTRGNYSSNYPSSMVTLTYTCTNR